MRARVHCQWRFLCPPGPEVRGGDLLERAQVVRQQVRLFTFLGGSAQQCCAARRPLFFWSILIPIRWASSPRHALPWPHARASLCGPLPPEVQLPGPPGDQGRQGQVEGHLEDRGIFRQRCHGRTSAVTFLFSQLVRDSASAFRCFLLTCFTEDGFGLLATSNAEGPLFGQFGPERANATPRDCAELLVGQIDPRWYIPNCDARRPADLWVRVSRPSSS